MSKGDYKESPLKKSKIYRGPQTPALQAYVPLPVFIGELIFMLLMFRLVGIWCVALLPLHLIPVAKTNKNPYWVRDLWQDFNQRWTVSNKGEYGKGVVSFHPVPPKKK
jgi:hypothetical protein